MVETSAVVCFHVFIYDGEKEIGIGSVGVSSCTQFSTFQSSMSQIIGVSSHQFTVFLVYDNDTMVQRRLPITSNFDFGSILTRKGCFFLVVLKRSKREGRRMGVDGGDECRYSSGEQRRSPPENVVILRRNPVTDNHSLPLSGFIAPTEKEFGFNQQIQYLEYESQKYLTNLAMNRLSVLRDTSVIPAICEECSRGADTAIKGGFHRCVNDRQVVGFRTAVGPIARPGK